MRNALDHILERWVIDPEQPSPIYLPECNRVWLAKVFKVLEFQAGAEIGTASGNYAYSLASRNRKAKLFCVDPYEAYDGYDDFDEASMLINYNKARQRLKNYDNVEFIRKYSRDALDLFEDGSLDYVYIDANHAYESVLFDIENWSDRVRSGGIIAGHDYSKPGVRQAVDEMAVTPWFLLNDDETWLWVKP